MMAKPIRAPELHYPMILACMAGTKRGGGAGGRKHERGEREASACYQSRCFCNPPTIFSTNPIMSLSIRDQSQVRGFSAWSELNYFIYQKLSSSDAFFKWYHNQAKWNIFTVLAPAANSTNIDYEQSLIFLLLAVYDKQWSVSCEYTRPFILQPHQAPWWSQRTEHWPAWDANNESKGEL